MQPCRALLRVYPLCMLPTALRATFAPLPSFPTLLSRASIPYHPCLTRTRILPFTRVSVRVAASPKVRKVAVRAVGALVLCVQARGYPRTHPTIGYRWTASRAFVSPVCCFILVTGSAEARLLPCHRNAKRKTQEEEEVALVRELVPQLMQARHRHQRITIRCASLPAATGLLRPDPRKAGGQREGAGELGYRRHVPRTLSQIRHLIHPHSFTAGRPRLRRRERRGGGFPRLRGAMRPTDCMWSTNDHPNPHYLPVT